MVKKESLRKEVKQKRKLLSEAFVAENSRHICDKLIKYLEARDTEAQKTKTDITAYDTYLLYASANNEVDLSYFIDWAMELGKTIAFPRVDKSGENDMDFYRIDSVKDLSEGNFHIMEPVEDCRLVSPTDKTICLVPGLVFSEKGNRIGYGRGFYDNYFNRYRDITKIGIAFDFQIYPDWEAYSSDVSMDAFITEKREVFINDKIRRNM